MHLSNWALVCLRPKGQTSDMIWAPRVSIDTTQSTFWKMHTGCNSLDCVSFILKAYLLRGFCNPLIISPRSLVLLSCRRASGEMCGDVFLQQNIIHQLPQLSTRLDSAFLILTENTSIAASLLHLYSETSVKVTCINAPVFLVHSLSCSIFCVRYNKKEDFASH